MKRIASGIPRASAITAFAGIVASMLNRLAVSHVGPPSTRNGSTLYAASTNWRGVTLTAEKRPRGQMIRIAVVPESFDLTDATSNASGFWSEAWPSSPTTDVATRTAANKRRLRIVNRSTCGCYLPEFTIT